MRIAAVHLPLLRVELARARALSAPASPMAVVIARPGSSVKDERSLLGGTRLDAVSREARAWGVKRGETIASSRARCSGLSVRIVAEGEVRGALESVAESGLSFGAMWKARTPRGRGLFEGVDFGDVAPPLPPLSRASQLALDYGRTGLSTSDHPMRIARATLPKNVRRSSELATLAHGSPVTSAGLVICRQRPGTASGVVFITMEDEEGFINLILYARVFDELRHVATTSSLLLARGAIEREGEVVYIVTRALKPLSIREAVPSMSRDFH